MSRRPGLLLYVNFCSSIVVTLSGVVLMEGKRPRLTHTSTVSSHVARWARIPRTLSYNLALT